MDATVTEDVMGQQIARRIRQLRAARGMTLQQISDRAGLSKGLLSKIENCITSPPIATLVKLANALDVQVADFFAAEEHDTGVVFFPASKRKQVPGRRSDLNYEYEMLVTGRRRRDMQPMLVSIDGRTCKFSLQEHPGEQFIFMVEGAMDYVVGDKTYHVGRGDCLYFDAHLPHGPKLQKTQRARYLLVFSGSH